MTPLSPTDRLALERTHLANERTLLAYTRTALGLGVAGAAFFELRRLVLGSVLAVAGAVVLLFGAYRYARTRRHLRPYDAA